MLWRSQRGSQVLLKPWQKVPRLSQLEELQASVELPLSVVEPMALVERVFLV